jgi:hypothetical protein
LLSEDPIILNSDLVEYTLTHLICWFQFH